MCWKISPGQSRTTQGPWPELPAHGHSCPQPGQSSVLTELSRFRFNSWLMNFLLCFALRHADLAHCSTFIINTFLEPVSHSDCWFYHYSSIKRGTKQFTAVRRCMKKFSQVFSLVEWDSTSMVNINMMPWRQLLLPNRLTSSLTWEGVQNSWLSFL